MIGYHAEHCTHNHKQQTQRHHGGHNGKTVVVRLLLCTGGYYVVARRVIAQNEVWTSARPRGVHVFSKRKQLLRLLILCSCVRMVSEDDRNEKHRSHTRRHTRPRARSSAGTPTCVVTYRQNFSKHSYVPRMNTEKVRKGRYVCFIALSELHQHHDPLIWHLATLLHDDRDAAKLRYRPTSRAQSLDMNSYDTATRCVVTHRQPPCVLPAA